MLLKESTAKELRKIPLAGAAVEDDSEKASTSFLLKGFLGLPLTWKRLFIAFFFGTKSTGQLSMGLTVLFVLVTKEFFVVEPFGLPVSTQMMVMKICSLFFNEMT